MLQYLYLVTVMLPVAGEAWEGSPQHRVSDTLSDTLSEPVNPAHRTLVQSEAAKGKEAKQFCQHLHEMILHIGPAGQTLAGMSEPLCAECHQDVFR